MASDDSWEWVLAHQLVAQAVRAQLEYVVAEPADRAPVLALGQAAQRAAAVGSHRDREQDVLDHCREHAWHHLAAKMSAHHGLLAELRVVMLALA